MLTMEEIEIIMDVVVDIERILTRIIEIIMIEIIEGKMDSSEETTKLIEIRDMEMIKKEISLLEIISEVVMIEMIIQEVLINKYY